MTNSLLPRPGVLALAIASAAWACGTRPVAVENPRPQLPNTGAIDGVVTDQSGQPLSGVAVVAGSQEGRSLAITNDAGEYTIGHLRPGSYVVTFDPCSLDSVDRTIEVAKGRVITADARLGVPPPPTITEIPVPKLSPSPAAPVSTAIEGTVVDQRSGAPLAGVAVVVTATTMSGTKSAITGDAGQYRITSLPPGNYEVTFYYGNVTVRRSSVAVALDQSTVVSVHIDTSIAGAGAITAGGDLGPGTGEGRGVNFSAATSFSGYAPVTADTGEQSVAARRRILAEANDADELWIIARGSTSDLARPSRRRYGSGQMCAYVPSTGRNLPLPLEQTDVRAQILSYAASVGVEQSYHNPFDEKIEAIYTFPLPHNAAVSDFVMTIGSRRIRGIIRERAEAEQIYAEARASGYVAALLTQQRPNIFTQKVSNIAPGKSIDISLTYFHMLPYRDGAYTFVFPTVVGPRFTPAAQATGGGSAMTGADGRTVSYLPRGKSPDSRLKMRVDIDAGMAIEGIESEHHAIDVRHLSPSRARVTLADGDGIPNQDYVLHYQVAGDRIKSAFMVHQERDSKYFSFVLQPPADISRLSRTPLEMVFVIDCSGSMVGAPLAKEKRAIRNALARLTPNDTFQIIRFSDTASPLGPRPLAATRKNIARGLRYLEALTASDGTEMVEGVEAALSFPHDDHRLRLVSFMTDGYFDNEAEILSTIHAKLGSARIFSFGVGTSVNRYLLERMAKIGRGAVAYVGLDDDVTDAAVDAFYQRISHPALTDISLDFGKMKVSEVYPSQIPDLFVGRPVIITGKLDGPAAAAVGVRGRVRGQPVRFAVDLGPNEPKKNPALAKLWARMKIADLTEQAVYSRNVAPLTKQIRNIALYHGIISSFTSFMTVDTSGTTGGPPERQVRVPVPLPEGVSENATNEE